MTLQLDHRETRMGRLPALVLLVGTRPRQRLRLVLDSENAEADGELMLDGEPLQAARAIAADIVVMRRLATDDAAERDIAVKPRLARAPRLRIDRETDRRGNLEGARHGDALIAGARRVERRDRAARELIGDMRIIARLDQHDMRRVAHYGPPGRSIARW